jgi:ATP-dependent DNA helicase RecQ
VPIEEQNVITDIRDAAQEGCEMDWGRFCMEVGLTPRIPLAIVKVGSGDKLKPIKEELSDNLIFS